MRIKTILSLFDAIEKMLQGLCYWMGYRYECYSGHPITEFAAIDIAVGVLNAHINHSTYTIRCEYPYSKIDARTTKERADLVILQKVKDENTGAMKCVPICVIEFKFANDANGGVWSDINKLNSLHSSLSISRIAVILSHGHPAIINDFVDNVCLPNEAAKKKIVSKKNVKSIPLAVIRSTKAMGSKNTRSPYRAIAIELT